MTGWRREPLVHFVVLGATLFALAQWRGSGAGSNAIVITPGQVDAMAATFSRTWQRPPTDEELKGLIDDSVREELAVREAVALGLDRDDTVIRRRLRQKVEFIVEGEVDATTVTDAELVAYFDRHRDRYQLEPMLTLRQVYLNPDRRGGSIDGEGQALVERLTVGGAHADVSTAGDRSPLPVEVTRVTQSEVARQFGEDFAGAVVRLATGRWTGPVRSTFGTHVVFVRERVDGRAPDLDEVRTEVERDLRSERRKDHLDAKYRDLLSRHRVMIAGRTSDATATASGIPR
jgi:hypothetical protein